jgi:uncharacterized transporter YbjL
MNTVIKRMKRPTPSFFKKLRNIGLALGAIGAAIISAPVAIPALLIKVAGYLVVAGTVAGAVSQTAVKNDK